MTTAYSLITPTTTLSTDVTEMGAAVTVSAEILQRATGWVLKPEGFCRADICVPARDSVDENGKVDLVCFAKLTGHPLVIDRAEQAIALGESSATRAQNMSNLQAPEFRLPDITGTQHALSDYRGKKVLLAAYASW